MNEDTIQWDAIVPPKIFVCTHIVHGGSTLYQTKSQFKSPPQYFFDFDCELNVQTPLFFYHSVAKQTCTYTLLRSTCTVSSR